MLTLEKVFGICCAAISVLVLTITSFLARGKLSLLGMSSQWALIVTAVLGVFGAWCGWLSIRLLLSKNSD